MILPLGQSIFINYLCAILALRPSQLSSCIAEPKQRLGSYSFLVGKTKTESHSVSGLRGSADFCTLSFKIRWLHRLLPLTSEGTLGDNSVKNNLLIEYWLLRISWLCLVELFVSMFTSF